MRKALTIRNRKWLHIALSLLPLLIIIVILRVYPIAVAFMKSFTNWNGLYQSDWVGFKNYIQFITSGTFLIILRNTLVILINVPLQVFFGLLVALLLYEKVMGWRFFRAVIYIPQIISAVIIGFLFKIFFGFEGPLNQILNGVGLHFLAIQWFGSSETALGVIVFTIVWFSIGWQAIVILGGMSNIDPSVFDAAIIDGANYWQRAFRIVLPMIMPVIQFCIIASAVWTLTQIFPFIYTMTNGGPGYQTTTLDYMIYLKAFSGTSSELGLACANSVILFLIIIGLTLIIMRLTNREDHGS